MRRTVAHGGIFVPVPAFLDGGYGDDDLSGGFP
jgi:hypothetical protein